MADEPVVSATPAATPATAAPPAPASATPPAAPAAPTTPTLAGDPAAASATPNPPAKFPDNWRDLLAGGDEKARKDLDKYTDPVSIYRSLRTEQDKIARGELKVAPKPLDANATDEQKAEWRKTNGLPDSVEAMVKGVQLPEGVVIGEADKPLIEDFAKSMFEGGASQAEMNRAVGWFYQQQDRIEQQREAQDSEARVASEVALRSEWGADYTKNMNAMGAVLASMPEDFRATLLTARGPDGQMLGNSPAFVKAMTQLGLELNPAATVVAAGDGNAAQTIENEIKTIEKSMYLPDGKQNGAYWKDEKMQARYRELIDAQAKMGQRTRAA